MRGFHRGSFSDLFCYMTEYEQGVDLSLLVLICWGLLVARNKTMTFNDTLEKSKDILARADRMGSSYHLITQDQADNKISPISSLNWQPPPCGVLKVNVDAPVMQSKNYFGIGIVGRDSNGIVHFAEGRCLSCKFTPHVVELIALKMEVEKVLYSASSNWEIEFDTLNVIHAIQNPAPYFMDDPIAETIQDSVRLHR